MNTGRSIPSRCPALLCLCGLALAVALAGGCDAKGRRFGLSKEPKGPPKDPKDSKIEQLQADVDTLTARVEELGKRNDRLVEKLNELEFLKGQLTKQLKAVADAPRMRDYYKDLVTQRQLEIERLKRQIQALEKALEKALRIPTTAPATATAPRPASGGKPTRPATGPASRPEGGQ